MNTDAQTVSGRARWLSAPPRWAMLWRGTLRRGDCTNSDATECTPPQHQPFWPKLLAVCALVVAWIALLVFGCRYPKHALAVATAKPTEEITKTYVVVRAQPPPPVISRAYTPSAPAVEPVRPVSRRVSTVTPPAPVPVPVSVPAPPVVGRTQTPSAPVEAERPAQRSVPTLLERNRRDVGRELMGVDGKKEGEVPIITMDYRRHLGWPGYVRYMVRLGGMFLVFDKQTERILAQADFLSNPNRLLDIRKDSLAGMSPRIREIHSEIAIAGLMDQARQKYGPSANTLILLVPLNVDFDIVGGIAQQLVIRNIEPKSVARVLGEYERTSTGLRLRARELIHRDGKTTPADFTIEL